MRAFFALTLLGCTASLAEPQLSHRQACAEGQTALEGAWGYTMNLTEWWEQLDGRFAAVLARRVTEPMPWLHSESASTPPDDGYVSFIECTLEAQYEIVDGLGWVDAEEIRVQGRTSQGYFARRDGTPVVMSNMVISEHFYDSNYESMAPDDEVYVLFLLPRSDGSYLLRRRADLVDNVVSGEHTESGEDAPLDLFRR